MATTTTPTPSGKGSPAADARCAYAVAPDPLVLENEQVRVEFDRMSGALISMRHKPTGWAVQNRPAWGESFRAFMPTGDRNFNPVPGVNNRLSSFELADDGDGLVLVLVWQGWITDYAGQQDVTLRGTVELRGNLLRFRPEVVNGSALRVDSLAWPILGDIAVPAGETCLTRDNLELGTMRRTPVYPAMINERGYWGTNYPMQVNGRGRGGFQLGGPNFLTRWMLLSGTRQGIYFGTHETELTEVVNYVLELKPGYASGFYGTVPQGPELDGYAVRLSAEATHLCFVGPHETRRLSEVTIAPYEGTWHTGIDIYKAWRSTWFTPPPAPAWTKEVHSWQQIQINSPEDDLRTLFQELPDRAAKAAREGISAIQLVGWNHGGQDRGNPSHDPDPRLGGFDALKEAIAKIRQMGLHLVLFNKYTWLELTTDAYRAGLSAHAACDPYGIPYYHPGYEYQTPVQLAATNTRRFAVACMCDEAWQTLCAREFRKSIDLGADGILYDEAFHHASANFCFSPAHSHPVPATLWSGDLRLGERFRQVLRETVGEESFLMSGEVLYDLQHSHYTLSYFRITPGHVPAERYANPYQPMMIAVTGFDDREMINRALLYRYLISYEPFNFKGDADDFPSTTAYGRKVDALRRRYADHLWHAEFRDRLGAMVETAGGEHDFSVFQQPHTGRRAVVLVNDERDATVEATIRVAGNPGELFIVSPERPEPQPLGATVLVPPRSAIVVLEGPLTFPQG